MVKLRLREIAEEKVFRLLSLTLGVSEVQLEEQKLEDKIHDFIENTEFIKQVQQIATELDQHLTQSEIAKVFDGLAIKEVKKKALVLLSKAASISEKDIQKYANEDINISEIFDDLTKLASVLGVETINLVASQINKEAVNLKISELAQNKNVRLSELSEKSQVDIAIVCFYATQPIDKKKLAEPKFQTNLTKISKVLECSIEDLQDTNIVELPPTQLRIQEFMSEKNLTLDEFSLLTGMSHEFIDLITNHPIDMKALDWRAGDAAILCPLICKVFGCEC